MSPTEDKNDLPGPTKACSQLISYYTVIIIIKLSSLLLLLVVMHLFGDNCGYSLHMDN